MIRLLLNRSLPAISGNDDGGPDDRDEKTEEARVPAQVPVRNAYGGKNPDRL